MKNQSVDNHSAGRLTERGHALDVRVYYEDTDFTGLVYHARYLQFFERGRSDFLRLNGIDHRALETGYFGEPLYFVVKAMALEFHSPARIDDVLNVETGFGELRGARIILPQEITRDQVKIASASVTIVVIDANGAPKRPPEMLVHSLLKP